jgi:hypothetical protein
MGYSPRKPFVNEDNPYAHTRVGVITYVDELHMRCNVRVLTGGEERFEVDLTQAMAGPRSFLGGIPEVNSLVIVAYRRKHKNLFDAVILGYIPVGNILGLRFDPFSGVNPNALDPEDKVDAQAIFGKHVRYKRIRGKPGDVMGMSASGAEFLLSKDVRLFNRAGDLIELRDSDRTLITQAVHRVHSDAGTYAFSGPIRRGAMDLPLDIFQTDKDGNLTRVLKTAAERYFGRDDLFLTGPSGSSFSNAAGHVLDRVNDTEEFPPVTYSNGRRAYYAGTDPAANFESSTGSGETFTEHRLEIRHTTPVQQEVREEIDGFSADRPVPFIEQVFGTIVGNDPYSSEGQRAYGRVLIPRIFDDFEQTAPPTSPGLSMDEASRAPGGPDEALTRAGAYLFRIRPPKSPSTSVFGVAVSKQGKLHVNVPGSSEEHAGNSRNISAEVNMEGALKMRLGATTPEQISLHMTLDGALYVKIGQDALGRSIITDFSGSVKNVYKGNDADGVARSVEVQGNAEKSISGSYTKTVQGSHTSRVSGSHSTQATDVAVSALNGYSVTAQSQNVTVAGKSQFNFALLVQETIAAGGKIMTVLAGGVTSTVAAGAFTQTVAAGATTFANPGGAFSVAVGAGALSLTTASGAAAITAGAGAVSVSAGLALTLTAGLAMNLSSGVAISLVAPQVLVGGPAAVFGVARGAPMHPPGSPSLDWITGSPLQGSAVFRSW